jgi:hypothetical protein
MGLTVTLRKNGDAESNKRLTLTVIVAPDPGGGRAADLPSDSPEGALDA